MLTPTAILSSHTAARRDLDDEQAALMNAKLVLILANQVGDRQVLAQALALARPAAPSVAASLGC